MDMIRFLMGLERIGCAIFEMVEANRTARFYAKK
jgi:hypothetical protein